MRLNAVCVCVCVCVSISVCVCVCVCWCVYLCVSGGVLPPAFNNVHDRGCGGLVISQGTEVIFMVTHPYIVQNLNVCQNADT